MSIPEYLRQAYRLIRREVKDLPTYPKDLQLKGLLYLLAVNQYQPAEAEIRSRELIQTLEER